MPADRTTLRRAVGDRLGDMVLLEATSVSGSADTFTDVVRLADRGDNAPSIITKIAYFAGTASQDAHEARITEFDSSSRTLTFDPAADFTPATGQEMELWSVSARVGSISTIHRLLNDGIRAVSREAGPEVYDDAQTFRARSPYLEIPTSWVEFGGADWVDSRGYTHEIPESMIVVRPGAGAVEIRGIPAGRANNRSIQLWGYDEATALAADTDTTTVDPEWLVESVLAALSLAASARASDIRGPAEERRAQFWATQAMQYRRNVAGARRGMGVTL